MRKAKFKAGDKVYCPSANTKISIVGEFGQVLALTFGKSHIPFDEYGVSTITQIPTVFHATPENHALLEKLYGVKFEAPLAPKNPKEIIQAMLDDGWYLVNYRIYGKLDNPPKHKTITKAQFGQMDNSYFNKNAYMNVEIFDPKTGKAIIDYVDGKVILETTKEQKND